MITSFNQTLVTLKNAHYFNLQKQNPALLATFKEGDLERHMFKEWAIVAATVGLIARVLLTPLFV